MERQPDNVKPVCKEDQDNDNNIDTAAVLQAATRDVDSLAIGSCVKISARLEGATRSGNASAKAPPPLGVEAAASKDDTDTGRYAADGQAAAGAVEGPDRATGGDDTRCGKPCAEEVLNDERAVLQILFDT